MTKPILSTPIMRYGGAGQYKNRRAGALCRTLLLTVFGKPADQPPQALRLHAFARPAQGRKRIQLARANSTLCHVLGAKLLLWTAWPKAKPGDIFWPRFGRWVLRRSPFADRLKKGETVTVYVELEVVEAAK